MMRKQQEEKELADAQRLQVLFDLMVIINRRKLLLQKWKQLHILRIGVLLLLQNHLLYGRRSLRRRCTLRLLLLKISLQEKSCLRRMERQFLQMKMRVIIIVFGLFIVLDKADQETGEDGNNIEVLLIV